MWYKLLLWILLVIVVLLYERTKINNLPAHARKRVWLVLWGIQIIAFLPIVIIVFDLQLISHTKFLEDLYKPLVNLIKKK